MVRNLCFIFLCLCSGIWSVAQETIWDVVKDYRWDIPQSQDIYGWAYGWMTEIGSNLNLYQRKIEKSEQKMLNDEKSNLWLCVFLNSSKEPTWGVPPGKFAFHPGPEGQLSVVRWTSCGNGKIEIKGSFGDGERGRVDAYIAKNAQIIFCAKNIADTHSFSLLTPISIGDRIDFLVGPGMDSYCCDTTPLEATIRFVK